jgi:hypothetical protein
MTNPIIPIAFPPILSVVFVSEIPGVRLYSRMIMRVAVVPTANAMLAGTIQSRGFVRMRVISRSRVESGIKEDNSSVQPTTDHPSTTISFLIIFAVTVVTKN